MKPLERLMAGVVAGAFLLGLVFNAAPGPVFAATLRHGMRGGFRPAMAVQIGSLVGDATWAVVGLAGVGLLGRLEALRAPIGIVGAAYLLWLARDAWRAGSHGFQPAQAPAGNVNKTALRAGMLLSLTNPQNIGYWAALGSALGAVGVAAPTGADYAAFFAGFMLSSVVWAVIFAAIVERVLGRVLGRAELQWARHTYRVCAVLFVAVALASLRSLWLQR